MSRPVGPWVGEMGSSLGCVFLLVSRVVIQIVVSWLVSELDDRLDGWLVDRHFG